jgi:hypothetical protein
MTAQIIYDEVTLCNMALGKIGIGQRVQDLSPDSGDVESTLSFWYPIVRDRLMEAFDWKQISKQFTLNLVATDPNDDWAFSYRMPVGCLVARRVVSGLGTAEPDPVPYDLGQDDQGILIYTDAEDAVLEGTFVQIDPSRYSSLFADALAWMLAAEIAMPLSVDASKRGEAVNQSAVALKAARGVANQNRRMRPQPASLFVSTRGGGLPRIAGIFGVSIWNAP